MKTEKTTTVECLLGVLSLQPMSGYEMRQFMEKFTANFWSESFGQIYPALKAMWADGLVSVEAHHGDSHPAKKVYSITDAGRDRLREWLAVPVRPQVNRIELLLKLFFGDKAQPGVMQAHLTEAYARAEAALHRYQLIEERMNREFAAKPGMPFWRMTVRFGISESQATMQWVRDALHELKTIEQ
jgi:PadR family transcriptional regulator AphA